MSRNWTTKLVAAMDDGVISAEVIANLAIGYMSEDDVKAMLEANDLLEFIDPSYEDEDEDTE